MLARSLKSANVLLDKQYRAKLADVGLAKTLTNCYGCDSLATYMSTGELGTFAWAAPEVASHTPNSAALGSCMGSTCAMCKQLHM